jgi:sialate O-acetylesterase
MQPGGPLELLVKGESADICCTNILMGDVWLCSGQSNMEWTVKSAANAEAETAMANYPRIRHLYVPHVPSAEPKDNFDSRWRVCSPKTVGDFTAVGYYFGRELFKNLDVPIGLIHSSWGGTPAEAWTDRATLNASPVLKPMVDRVLAATRDEAGLRRQYEKDFAAWENLAVVKDPGNKGYDKGWAGPDFDDSAWKTMDLPRLWESLPDMIIDGAVWFRRTVSIPEAWEGKDLTLSLGAIDDYDTTYFDGEAIGAIGRETPNWWATPRVYTIPGGLVRAGRQTISVRVFDRMYGGGFGGTEGQMFLEPQDKSGQSISLSGDWKYQIEFSVPHRFPPIPEPQPPMLPDHHCAASALYNGMIHPLVGVPISGAIWYQGESNAERAEQYRTLLPAMISNWRKLWGYDFPFYIVQLANHRARALQPCESAWAELREAQSMACKLPNTGIAVTADIGEAMDIHPRNKQDVGKRLAYVALKQVYKKDIEYTGPVLESAKAEGDSIRLRFTHADGLTIRGDAKGAFAVAGSEGTWEWADATVSGSDVIVKSAKVKSPVAVRYGWADNPPIVLYNKAGLPASPFRTDDWPLITTGRR